jgi:sterol desaturase/sphingolipid hydroxylase (fatty acid hydroxylase superfamily)
MPELPQFLGQGRTPGGFLAIALLFIALELIYLKLVRYEIAHDIRETAASVGVAFGDVASRVLTGWIAAVPLLLLYQHRLLDIPLDKAWGWVALFLGVEVCYYGFHRAAHRIRWLWATHAVHHSATQFNLSAAIRLGWTGTLTGAFIFFLPLAWLGFHPLAIGAVLGLGLLYQFFLHTALDVHLGPLEWILNTPRHHRVHHASNDACLDKNYGNVLIIFDRLFGTFAEAPADEALRFGLKGRRVSNNPFGIAFNEWGHLWRDVREARSLRERVAVLLGPP